MDTLQHVPGVLPHDLVLPTGVRSHVPRAGVACLSAYVVSHPSSWCHCSKNNAAIVSHMEAEGIDFLQFAFRWVNCLLIREVPFAAALRLWDTYLAEGPRFSEFLVRQRLKQFGQL